MSADIIMKRIRRENKTELNLLSEILAPETLHVAVPRLAEVREARVERQNMLRTMDVLKQNQNTNLQYVAQIDQATWSVILEVFAKIDPVTGNPMHDGKLYIEDSRGNVVVNRPFFYTLLAELKRAGYDCDMRGKRKITV
jgi:hypothetical protein